MPKVCGQHVLTVTMPPVAARLFVSVWALPVPCQRLVPVLFNANNPVSTQTNAVSYTHLTLPTSDLV